MKNTFIYPKNYFSKKTLFLEDSKWKIYNTSNNNAFKEKNDKIYNTNSNYNLYKNQYLTNNYKSIPIINNELDNKVENIKLSLYSKINQNSSKLFVSLEKIKYLTKENMSLKQIIKNKDKIILDFESLFHKVKEKFIKLDNINQSLREKLMGRGEITKEINLQDNRRDILEYFDIIKNDINKIESDYNNKLKEKDELLDKMNEELLNIHKEYKYLSEILEKMNDFIMKTNYNDLKNKVNELMEENEFLYKQNEKREKRIIDLQKKNEQISLEENDNINTYNIDDLIVTFKNQEDEYVKTINMLQNRIVEKDKEIQMVKEEYNNILNEKYNFS